MPPSRPRRRRLSFVVRLLLAGATGLVLAVGVAWTLLAPAGLSPGAAWSALTERTPSHWIRYAQRRLEGHTNLEKLALPVLHAAQRRYERPVPSGLPHLGKGQREAGLTPQRYDAQGHPLPSQALSDKARPPLADVIVSDFAGLKQAVENARPGQIVEVLPGTYAWPDTLRTRGGGLAEQPILLRARDPGTVRFEVTAMEALVLRHPYWQLENLEWVGKCKVQGHCEHALHVVGQAKGTAIRNVRMQDFNAHIKVNGEGGRWPDAGIVQFSTLSNSETRRVYRIPVVPFDLVAASNWIFSDNLVLNFPRDEPSSPSYGVFMKGGGSGGLIQRNLIVCSAGDISEPGVRVGISLGGGLTGKDYMRDPQSPQVEHSGGRVLGNVIAHCNDSGIDLNRATQALVQGNILVNTSGIGLREGSQAIVMGNTLDGYIRVRQTSSADQSDNKVGDTRAWFHNPDQLDLRPR